MDVRSAGRAPRRSASPHRRRDQSQAAEYTACATPRLPARAPRQRARPRPECVRLTGEAAQAIVERVGYVLDLQVCHVTRVFAAPHGFHIDPEANIWGTDYNASDTVLGLPAGGPGHQVFKFRPTGEILMASAGQGSRATGRDTFDRPSDVAVNAGSEIFVTDRHRPNNPVVKFRPERPLPPDVGRAGQRPRRVRPAAHPHARQPRTGVRRRPVERPRADLRARPQVRRRVAAVRPGERDVHRRGRRALRDRLDLERKEQPRLRPRHLHRERGRRRPCTPTSPTPTSTGRTSCASPMPRASPPTTRATSTPPKSAPRESGSTSNSSRGTRRTRSATRHRRNPLTPADGSPRGPSEAPCGSVTSGTAHATSARVRRPCGFSPRPCQMRATLSVGIPGGTLPASPITRWTVANGIDGSTPQPGLSLRPSSPLRGSVATTCSRSGHPSATHVPLPDTFAPQQHDVRPEGVTPGVVDSPIRRSSFLFLINGHPKYRDRTCHRSLPSEDGDTDSVRHRARY